MIKSLQLRILIIVVAIGAAIYYGYPLGEKINLGLDLRGGMHLVLRVETDKAVEAELFRIKSAVEKELIKRRIDFGDAVIEDLVLKFNFKVSEARDKAYEYLKSEYAIYAIDTAGTLSNPSITIEIPQTRIAEIKEQSFEQALETIRNRIDETGVKEPIVQRQGISGDRILIQLPGEDNPERAKKIIGRTAFLEFKLVKEGPASKESILERNNGTIPFDAELLPFADPTSREQLYYLVDKESKVSGADLADARVGRGEYGQYAVDFEFNRFGATKFGEVTGENIGKALAIILDGKVQSAPNIKSRITSRGTITGSFTYNEAQDLSIVLRAGALPAPVVYLEERTVGPTLGQDSIDKGIRALSVSGILVLIFMIVYYKGAGLIADFSMLLNLAFILGCLAGLQATLTLPGIAGLILTIGTAVDSNILIYERIKEELKIGKTIRTAVAAGYERALLTIIDANVTTLIAALVLMNFGTGPVRGFAVTLTIGIVTSVFCALIITRVIFDIILLNRDRSTISI